MSEEARATRRRTQARRQSIVGTEPVVYVGNKYKRLSWALDERQRRLWAANEAVALGYGGGRVVAEATGMSDRTVQWGHRELQQRGLETPSSTACGRIRRPGGGRPSAFRRQPGLEAALEKRVDPATRGDPQSPLRWTSKSLRHLQAELQRQGYRVSASVIGAWLNDQDYSLQANRKVREGSSHSDRDAQFQSLAQRVETFQPQGQPVLSVDAKKKEPIGNFKNGGREWQPPGQPVEVKLHDFGKDKVTPYGVFEPSRNCGWVSVGTDPDTAEFAVESIRRWWRQLGQQAYPEARQLLVTADAGGSHGYRPRLWKLSLQPLADESGLTLSVCHLPPGTSKWNKIEHRRFCHITANWRAKPLVSHEVVVNLIGATQTSKGLHIQAELDNGRYPKGRKITDQQMAQLQIQPADFHGEWNYTISPRQPDP
jgi:hypothetical protein